MSVNITTKLPNLGLSGEVVEQAIELLQTLLADEYVLYTKLRKYHWNVRGPQFKALHELFEMQYTELEVKIDTIAERVRAYGAPVIGTMAEFTEQTRLDEQAGVYPDATSMVASLVQDHEQLIRHLREDVETADDLDDVGLEDFLTAQLQAHQEMAWMLRSFMGDDSF